jgi:hypothetical protein
MKAKGLALDQALAVLRARAPHVSPNLGFMAQLELWGEMGCCCDEDHPAYKQFMLDQVRHGKHVTYVCFVSMFLACGLVRSQQ